MPRPATRNLQPKLMREEELRLLTDPVCWQENFLGRRLWAKQQEILQAVTRYPLVAVKGCHASGKTYAAAGLPVYHLSQAPQSLCFTTAPTLRQVKTFWKEVHVAWSGSVGPLKRLIPEPQATGVEVMKDCYAFGASSSAGVNIQGPHAEHLLIIADEAPGIEPDVWDAIEGMRAGGDVHMLAMGNPVVPSGLFYDAFTKHRALWQCYSISAFDTPNLAGVSMEDGRHADGSVRVLGEGKNILELSEEELGYAPYPFLITRRWVKERLIAWGVGHPKFRSRVLAEFPHQSPYAVFDLAWIERAKREATEAEVLRARDRGAVIQCGLDVAGPGDDQTVLTARCNGMILGQWAWHDPDPRATVHRQLSELRRHPQYRLGSVVVDTTGIGYYFAKHLADAGFTVFGFNAGSAPIDTAQYLNLKAEAYFQTRKYFQDGLISGLQDDDTEGQLSTIQYRETGRGLTEIESKEDARKRGVPSPDRAESLIMAFLRIVPREQHVERFDHRVQISPV